VYFRHNETDSVMVALNRNTQAVALALDRFEERLEGFGVAHDVLTGEDLPLGNTLPLPPLGVRVLELR
jgi:hypothetical protein